MIDDPVWDRRFPRENRRLMFSCRTRGFCLSGHSQRLEEWDEWVPGRGWAELIREIYEVGPKLCPKGGSQMGITAFLTGYEVVDRITNLNLIL